MKGLALFIVTLVIAAALFSSNQIEAWAARIPLGSVISNSAQVTTPSGEQAVLGSAAREGLVVQVHGYRPQIQDGRPLVLVEVTLENHSPEDWNVVPQSFYLQDRTHRFTYPALDTHLARSEKILQHHVLAPGESGHGYLIFQAPTDAGLDLAFGLLSATPASYIRLAP